MSLFESPGLRSDAEIRAARVSLDSLHGKQVGRLGKRAAKLRKNRSRGNGDQLTGSLRKFEVGAKNPNAPVEVYVSLPRSMVVAAGDKLEELVYEGLRDRLNFEGVQWFGPRFLMVVAAKRAELAERKSRFTL